MQTLSGSANIHLSMNPHQWCGVITHHRLCRRVESVPIQLEWIVIAHELTDIYTHDPTPSIHKQNPNGPHTNTGSCVCVCTRSMLICCFGCVLSVGINLNDFTLNYTVRVCCASVRTHTVMHARHHLSVIIIYTIKKRRRPLVTVFVPHIFCRRPIDERTLGACVARLFDPFG